MRVGKLKNGKDAGKDEVTRLWIGYGGYIIWPLRVVMCLKIGDLL